jgi:LPS sulfotransferase NodH
MRAGNSVILCASQRTGSTLVFDDFLNLIGQQRRDSEILYNKIILAQDKQPWNEVWDEVRTLNTVHSYFVGKVMFHYAGKISSFIQGNSPAGPWDHEFTPERFNAFHDFFSDAIWVYIDRRNVFAQAVSMYLAEATNVWEKLLVAPGVALTSGSDTHSVEPELSDSSLKSSGSPVRYEGEKLKGYLKGFLAAREQWQIFFQYYKITPLRISYEDAVSCYPHYLQELLDKVGRPMVDAPPPRRMLKVGGKRNEEWAEFLRNDVIAELYSRTSTPD